MKKAKPYLLGLIVILAAELLVGNFSALRSLAYKSVDLTPYMQVAEAEASGVIVRFEGLDEKIRTLFLDAEIPYQQPLGISVWLSDDGNSYAYDAGDWVIASQSPKTHYLTLHPYGNIKGIELTLTPAVGTEEAYAAEAVVPEIRGVIANKKQPIFFNIPRVLFLYLLFLFLYGLRSTGSAGRVLCAFEPEKQAPEGTEKQSIARWKTARGRQRIIIISSVIITIVISLLLTGSHRLFNEATKPHHQQYKELAHSLREGTVALPYEPSGELLAADNPYDTIFLQARGIEYRADYAYYDGAYYVYFGLVPELLLYFPYYCLTGRDFPNHAAVFLFFAGFAVGVFLLYWQLCRRFFRKLPFAVYLMLSLATVWSPTLAYVLFTADLYSVPIMAALCFTAWGLALWITALSCERERARVLCCVFGSLCMALVVGCRPQLLLFSVLLMPLFWESVVKKKEKLWIPLVTPYLLVAVPVMYYNAVRFGSVFDFGATYSLTNNDMTHRGFSLSRALGGIGAFLWIPPQLGSRFPFLRSAELSYLGDGYLGPLTYEFLLGGVMTVNVLTFSLLLLPRFRKPLRQKGLWDMSLISVFASLAIAAADANTAGILQRYSADLAFGLLLATTVLLFLLAELFFVEKDVLVAAEGAFSPYAMLCNMLKAGLILQLFVTLFTVCNTESGITLARYNPELFYRIAGLFRF